MARRQQTSQALDVSPALFHPARVDFLFQQTDTGFQVQVRFAQANVDIESECGGHKRGSGAQFRSGALELVEVGIESRMEAKIDLVLSVERDGEGRKNGKSEQ